MHWLARCLGTPGLTPVLLLLLCGLTLYALASSAPLGHGELAPTLVFSLLAVAAGCAALAWVRPQRAGLSPPHVMLSLGFGGMLAGLLLDMGQAGPLRLASLCGQSAPPDLLESLRLHLAFLPWMHAGMLAGGMLAIPGLRLLRGRCGNYLCSLFLQNLLCSAWMLLGMSLGALSLSRWPWAGATGSPHAMLGGMFAGMTWGMVLSVALYRAYLSRPGRRLPSTHALAPNNSLR
jgi:hypothetical protein